MKSYIESRIENLKKTLSWKEEELEKSRLSLVGFAGKCTGEEIAHGCLNQDIRDIGRKFEEVKSIRDQIELLEYILKNSERGGESCE